jgi:hypothetical protein
VLLVMYYIACFVLCLFFFRYMGALPVAFNVLGSLMCAVVFCFAMFGSIPDPG